jgi:hypothetical protein
MNKPKSRIKLLVGIFFFFLLIVGSLAGYFLSQQSQDIRQQAFDVSDPELYPCPEEEIRVAGVCKVPATSIPSPAMEPENGEVDFVTYKQCRNLCDGTCEGSNKSICVPKPLEPDLEDVQVELEDEENNEDEKGEKGDRCSIDSCNSGLTCATSPFGNFCVAEDDAGNAELANLEEEEEEAPENSLGYNSESECNSKCDTSCAGPSNRYCLDDDLYITENDYDVCRENGNTHAECGGIVDNVGKEEVIPTPIPTPNLNELADDYVSSTNAVPDYLIPPDFDPDDNLSLTQDPMMRATLEAEYADALEKCEDNHDGLDEDVCKYALDTALAKGVKTRDTCVSYYMINNPNGNVTDVQDQCSSERGRVAIFAGVVAAAPTVVGLAELGPAGIYSYGSNLIAQPIAGAVGSAFNAGLSYLPSAIQPYVAPALVAGLETYGLSQGIKICETNPGSFACAATITGVQFGFLDDGARAYGNIWDQGIDDITRPVSGLPNSPAGWTFGTYGNQIDALAGTKPTEVGGLPIIPYRNADKATLIRLSEDQGVTVFDNVNLRGRSGLADTGGYSISLSSKAKQETVIHETMHAIGAGEQIIGQTTLKESYGNECITCQLTIGWLEESGFPSNSAPVLRQRLYGAFNYNAFRLAEEGASLGGVNNMELFTEFVESYTLGGTDMSLSRTTERALKDIYDIWN